MGEETDWRGSALAPESQAGLMSVLKQQHRTKNTYHARQRKTLMDSGCELQEKAKAGQLHTGKGQQGHRGVLGISSWSQVHQDHTVATTQHAEHQRAQCLLDALALSKLPCPRQPEGNGFQCQQGADRHHHGASLTSPSSVYKCSERTSPQS